MEIKNARYALDQGHPTLELEVDGKLVQLHSEPKPTLVRNGIVVLGDNFELPDIQLTDEAQGVNITLKGATQDRTVFQLYLAFGLEIHYGRFQEGDARQVPNPGEVRELGDRLARFTLANSPSWESLTNF